MAKKTAFAPKPPVAKLPLAVRKDLRDNYESNKEDFESQISELLGTAFVLNIDAASIWAYAEDSDATKSSTNAGRIIVGYVEGLIYNLKYFVEKYGDEGKADFNKTVAQSSISIEVNPLGEEGERITADIKDGVFRILFKPSYLGYNQNDVDTSVIVKAIDAAASAGGGFSLKAKNSIDIEWTENEEDLQKEIGEILNLPDITLDPNFEENYAALKAEKKDDDWQGSFGRATFAYFSDGFKYQLSSQGFKGDDLLQEGFAEAVSTKTVKLRIVKKTASGNRNEPIVEDGVLYLQTVPDYWYYNVSDIADNLVNVL